MAIGKVKIIGLVLVAIVIVVVFSSLDSQDSLGLTPEEFRNAYDNSFINDSPKTKIRSQEYFEHNGSKGYLYDLSNGVAIGAELNSNDKIKLLNVSKFGEPSIYDFQIVVMKVLCSINSNYKSEYSGVETFLQDSNAKTYNTNAGNILLEKHILHNDDNSIMLFEIIVLPKPRD